jgi:hypothetical protein
LGILVPDNVFFHEKMKFSLPFLVAAVEAAVIGRSCEGPKPDEDGRYTISSDGIKAQVCRRATVGRG